MKNGNVKKKRKATAFSEKKCKFAVIINNVRENP